MCCRRAVLRRNWNEYIGKRAIVARIGLSWTKLMALHTKPSSELAFPMFLLPHHGKWNRNIVWVTNDMLIFEWQRRLAKFNYQDKWGQLHALKLEDLDNKPITQQLYDHEKV